MYPTYVPQDGRAYSIKVGLPNHVAVIVEIDANGSAVVLEQNAGEAKTVRQCK